MYKRCQALSKRRCKRAAKKSVWPTDVKTGKRVEVRFCTQHYNQEMQAYHFDLPRKFKVFRLKSK